MEICIRPENRASLRVVEKLGFRYEGLRRRYIHIDGDWRDHYAFALVREEVPMGVLERWVQGRVPQGHRDPARRPSARLRRPVALDVGRIAGVGRVRSSARSARPVQASAEPSRTTRRDITEVGHDLAYRGHMGGQVLGGGVIVLVAALLWLVYLLPSWASRRQYDAAERNAVRLNQALRVLAETSETPEEVRLGLNTRTALAQQGSHAAPRLKREELAKRTEAELHQAGLEEARLALAVARDQPAARRARARRRARLLTTTIGLVAVGLVTWGAWATAWGL